MPHSQARYRWTLALSVPGVVVCGVLAKVLLDAVPANAASTLVSKVQAFFDPKPTATAKDLGVPYDRYRTTDPLGRDIQFYVSTPPKTPEGEKPKDLPLALFIQGSGGTSVFQKAPDGRVGGGLQNLLLKEAKGRFRVMCVEKPGVEYLANPQPPGSAMGCSEEFRREHTAERWTVALSAALSAARTLPGIDARRVLVAGHSEGADMAAHVAKACPEVANVAVLSGGGPTQLFDLALLAGRGQFGDPSISSGKAVEAVYAEWAKIAADPDRTDLYAWGHPYRRWSSFMKMSPMESLRTSSAKVFLAYGTADTSVPPESCDVLRATLTAAGRDVTVERREGEDHGFSKPNQGPTDGFTEVIDKVIAWWLGEKAS